MTALLSLLSVISVHGVAAEPAAKPNVLFIAVDDLNDWCGVMRGHPQVRTPNLDRLAARGVFFDRAYCSAPACNPSRASLLTGMRPSTSGMYVNEQSFRQLVPDAVTLPQYFTAQGYRVAGCGKIFHHGRLDPQSWPEYFNTPKDPLPKPFRKTPITAISNSWSWQALDVPDKAMSDYKVASWAINWLKQDANTSKPFFLAAGFYRPHMPLHVPRKYFDAHPIDEVQLPVVKEDDLDDLSETARWFANHRSYHRLISEGGEWPKIVQAYLASIEFMDAQLGRLLDALDASPTRDNTIIVLWSDHGWHLGEKEHWSKFALWEQTTRVPFLIVAPGITQPNMHCGTPVSLLDIYPTLTELCGFPHPEFAEGISLVPQLREPDAPRDEPALTTFGPNNHSLRDSRWRYIRYFDGSEELYDHNVDPHEWTNLAKDSRHHAEIVRFSRWLPKINRPLDTETKWLPPGN